MRTAPPVPRGGLPSSRSSGSTTRRLTSGGKPQSRTLAAALTRNPSLKIATATLTSHLLGAAWVCAMLLETLSMTVTDEGQRLATVVFLLSALFCTVASSLYHLLGGILSQRTYRALYQLDINGISVVIAGSYYPG